MQAGRARDLPRGVFGAAAAADAGAGCFAAAPGGGTFSRSADRRRVGRRIQSGRAFFSGVDLYAGAGCSKAGEDARRGRFFSAALFSGVFVFAFARRFRVIQSGSAGALL